jgi:ATP-dependent RNA helicase RhlE
MLIHFGNADLRCLIFTKGSHVTTFADLGLSPNILKAIDEAGYKNPSPIQEDAIPLALAGHDIMGLAQTGTGKTAAFGLPLIEKLMSDGFKAPPKNTKSLILAPTRELVNQIAENLRQYVRKTHLKVNLVVGGVSINRQIQNLSKGTDILVATPGRLLDLIERRAIFLDSARFLVLDEADQMLDMGFIHALRKIAPLLGTPRQTMLFSATMPKLMAELAGAYLKDPKRVQVSTPGKAADKIKQSLYYTAQANKTELLKEYLNKSPDGLSLVFSRTKHGAEKLKRHLESVGYSAVSIHGNKSQGQRERAIKAFKSGEARVLVATDVAARGIDIPDVSHVYNYDLPEVPENYVHRIGRTARAGKGGEAIAFVSATEIGYLKQIEKLMKSEIPCDGGIRPQEEKPAPRGGGGGGRRGGGGRHRGGGGGKPAGSARPEGQNQGGPKRKRRRKSGS